ncbi:unnamed protein product [Natator depressus]
MEQTADRESRGVRCYLVNGVSLSHTGPEAGAAQQRQAERFIQRYRLCHPSFGGQGGDLAPWHRLPCSYRAFLSIELSLRKTLKTSSYRGAESRSLTSLEPSKVSLAFPELHGLCLSPLHRTSQSQHLSTLGRYEYNVH